MDTKLDDIFNRSLYFDSQVDDLDDSLADIEAAALMAKVSVPFSHRRIASGYVILKDIFQYQIVQPRISNVEIAMLAKYAFSTLENTPISKVNKEILQLKEWATSTDDTLRNDSNELLRIRVKELKFILSNNYSAKSGELLNGYKAMEAYLVNINRYYK